jgi:putative ABC transport system ATP-binding protein
MIYAGYSKSERTARAAEVLEQVNLVIEWTTKSVIGWPTPACILPEPLVNKPSIIIRRMNLQET